MLAASPVLSEHLSPLGDLKHGIGSGFLYLPLPLG